MHELMANSEPAVLERGAVPRIFLALVCFAALAWPWMVPAQPAPGVVCKPVSERTSEVGCWIVAHQHIGQLMQSPVFWHIDAYPTRAAAEAAKGPRGTVVQAFGRVWLLTIEDAGWRPSGGERVAEIGPLLITPGEDYSARYMEAVFNPGMTAPPPMHSGPEAWYTMAGETCLETPEGKQVGSAGGHYVIVPAGSPNAPDNDGDGAAARTDPPSPRGIEARDDVRQRWAPKGLCRVPLVDRGALPP